MTKIQEFLQEATVIDTETTGVNFKEDEVVEVAGGRLINDEWKVESLLMGSNNPVPPGASAVNNISNKMIAGLPKFDQCIETINDIVHVDSTKYMVAHNSNFDRRMMLVSYERANDTVFNKFEIQEDWICTWKLAQQLYPKDGVMKYSLAYLRYYLELDISDDMLAHRAGADVTMCGILLQRLIEEAIKQDKIDDTQDIGTQLQKLCWQRMNIDLWPLGKHKGTKISEVPTKYLMWCTDKIDLLDETHTKFDKDLFTSVVKVLESRL